MAMFDPRTAVMDSDYSPEYEYCDHADFGFAFNNISFSDRLLRINIFPEPMESTVQSASGSGSGSGIVSIDTRVELVYISSPILAARSPFFYKLFTNGMRESEQHDINLRISASEEAAFMELLNFMYSDNLTVTTADDLFDVIMVADKFDVASCMRHCSRLLTNLPMTPETVLVYLDLPSTILTAEPFRPITVAAKQFYAVHYKDITKFQDEILSLPLASVEAIISSDDLKVSTEDAVYSFVLKWARAHYPKTEDCREIVMTRLVKFIRFPYMTYRKLTEVLTCEELDPAFAQKVVREAISFQAEVPQEQYIYKQRFAKRAYQYEPVKKVKFEQPYPHDVVYLDLKRDVCENLFPSGSVCSEAFNLGGQEFYLYFQCSKTINILQERSFRIVLGMLENVAVSFAVDYEFAVRSKSSEGFVTKCHGSYTFEVKQTRFDISLFVTPWRLFIGKDSGYFVDDVFHLSSKLSVRDLTNSQGIE